MSSATQDFDFNPFAPGFAEDPYPTYAGLRSAGRAHQHPLGFWTLSHYPDVVALLRSKNSVEDRNLGPSPLRDIITAMAGQRSFRALGLSMLDRDPPDHTRLRRLVTKAFTVRSVAALEPRVTELVDAELDRLAEAGGGDLIEMLAYPLPFTVICDLLGMPETDHAALRELAAVVVGSLEPVVDPDRIAVIERADREISDRIASAIADKRRRPADDLLTALIEAEADGDTLTDDELVSQVTLLYVAGHETTVNLIANGTLVLLRNPAQADLLRRRPDLDANAVEELLRYDSPVQMSRRVMLAPYEVGGRTIPAGTFVQAGLASANRDETFWGPDADQPLLDRPNAKAHPVLRRRAAPLPWRRAGPAGGSGGDQPAGPAVPWAATGRRGGLERPAQPARPGGVAGGDPLKPATGRRASPGARSVGSSATSRWPRVSRG